MISATATEIQNNFGKYLNMVINGNEVIVIKNGNQDLIYSAENKHKKARGKHGKIF